MPSGETLELHTYLQLRLSEKNLIPSFLLLKRLMLYTSVLTNTTVGRIGVVSVIDGGDDALAETNFYAYRSSKSQLFFHEIG